MIVYTATKDSFCSDVRENRIEYAILDSFQAKLKRGTTDSEKRAWRDSMQYMYHIIEDARIPDDIGIAIEYTIPQSSKRIDFVVSGFDSEDNRSAVIIELKQWSTIGVTEKDGIVEAMTGGNSQYRETPHPSYQAWSYSQLLQDFNEYVYESKPSLTPCAYLHNCQFQDAIRSDLYKHHLENAPVFIQGEHDKLIDFISKNVRKGDRGELLYEIENGRIRPSKQLANHMVSLLKGNREFTMIDEQKLVYETAVSMAMDASVNSKQVLIVHGGPGTGKSVVAINLLVELLKRKKNTQYLSTNSAPREVYERKLASSMRKTRIAALFRGTAAFVDCEQGEYDCLIVDESHRLVEKTRFNKGENQIKEIIEAANCSIFFIDESQRVTMKDIGSVDSIRGFASSSNANVVELELASQFRCNGSNGYLAWLDNTLGVRPTANTSLAGVNYEFEVCNSPLELRHRIVEQNASSNRARLVAGYCWPWLSKKSKSEWDIVIPESDFRMQWNFTDSGTPWLIDENSVEQVGCIHTSQGLELEYVGVILGRDFVIRDGQPICDFTQRARNDSSWKGFKTLLKKDRGRALAMQDEIVKNTYRVLMTRGQKGCAIWSVDPETNEWFRSCI